MKTRTWPQFLTAVLVLLNFAVLALCGGDLVRFRSLSASTAELFVDQLEEAEDGDVRAVLITAAGDLWNVPGSLLPENTREGSTIRLLVAAVGNQGN
jgi:hypothetical protein